LSIHRITIEIDIDDELLREHDGNHEAPPNDIREWDGGDLQAAFEKGLAEPAHDVEIEYHGCRPY
jgi:hypothetical protein